MDNKLIIPGLQEFPDPITRVTWDNYLTVCCGRCQEESDLKNENAANGALNGSYAQVNRLQRKSIIAPVLIQPGQAKGNCWACIWLW